MSEEEKFFPEFNKISVMHADTLIQTAENDWIMLKEIWPLRQEVAKLKAENEQLKTCLLQMQNAAIDLTKQLAQAERAAWDAAQDAVTLEDNFGGEAHIKYGKFEDWKKEHHEKEADKEA